MNSKIIIVEDEPQLRENIRELLEVNDYQVLALEAGDNIAEVLSKFKPDLILCDIKMPRHDGYWVLNEVRNNKQFGKIPFIFISAKVERRDVRVGMDLGADDYLTKPFSSEELLSAIQARLSRVEDLKNMDADSDQQNNIPKAKAEDFNVLTPAEKRILYLIAQNATSLEIASRFLISLKTVENHRSKITSKLGLKGHLSLLRYCLNNKKVILEQNWR